MIERARTLAESASGFWFGLILVASYALLRTLGAPEPVIAAWTVVAALATVASPTAGLTILAALGPFTEAQTADGRITPVPFLVAATGFSLVVHLLLTRALPRLSLPIILALLLFAGTATGVAVSAAVHGSERGLDALEMWVPGLGGGLTVLLAAAWVSWRGEIRPMFVAVGAIALGALLSLGNAITNDALIRSSIGWLLRPDIDPFRLGGLLPVPNTAAALFIVGTIVCLAICLATPSARVRGLTAAAAVVQVVALALTFSRSGYIALAFGVVLLLAWRWPRRIGRIAVTAAVVAVPVLIALWAFRDVPLAGDGPRLLAWSATLRMVLANPLLGTGFRSFEWLHSEYGSPIVNAPHNEWLRLFAEEGAFIGVVGLAFAIATPIVLLRSRDALAAGTGAAAAALFLSAFFNNPFINSQLNVPAFLIIGTGLGIVARLSQQPARYSPIASDHGRSLTPNDAARDVSSTAQAGGVEER